VAGQAARNDEDCVDAHVIAGSDIPRGETLGSDGDAPQAVFVEGETGGFVARSRLYLDESRDPAAARDQIDFAAFDLAALREDAPAVEPQPKGRDPLSATAPSFGLDPVHLARSSARA
jgi:hypothetical protein